MITNCLIQDCKMAVVVSGAVLLGIVFAILALHISAAVKIRRLQEKELCLGLPTIFFTGSSTISLSACVQVCRYLTLAVIGPNSKLSTLWYIADSVCGSVYVCHIVALVMYLCYFMYTYVTDKTEIKNNSAIISVEDENSSSSCSNWKSPHTSRHFQPPASPQTVHPAEHQPVTVDTYKQSSSHSDATSLTYFFTILVTAGLNLYLFSLIKEYHTASPTTSNPIHLWIVKILMLISGAIQFIAVNCFGLDSSFACKASIMLSCFLIFLNISIPFMCEYQCHKLLRMLSLFGMFNAPLTSYYLAIDHI